jgi:hypothetical protein
MPIDNLVTVKTVVLIYEQKANENKGKITCGNDCVRLFFFNFIKRKKNN